MTEEKQSPYFFIILVAVLIILALSALCIGRYIIPLESLFQAIFAPENVTDPKVSTVLWQVRLPRIIMAILAGAGLAISGASLQAMFANPLVSEEILGVSYGAGFGAAFGILFFSSTIGIELSSIFFAFVAMFATYSVAKKNGRVSTLMLILAGIIISSLFSAGISILEYTADSEKELPTIVFWLMGGLSKVTMPTVIRVAPILLICIFILYKIRWQLNLISLSEEESISLGVNVKRIRLLTVVLTTFITAVIVSTCGIISFVGLIVPHFTRMAVGSDNKRLIPAAGLFGACFIIIVDTIARTATPSEIPLSVLTSLIGAPFFAYLLHKTGGIWND